MKWECMKNLIMTVLFLIDEGMTNVIKNQVVVMILFYFGLFLVVIFYLSNFFLFLYVFNVIFNLKRFLISFILILI